MHDRLPLTGNTNLSLELVRITSYPSGLAVQLALTATGRPARRAWHETRPLTDPTDLPARWSSLEVWAGTGDLAVADPYFLRPDLRAADAGFAPTAANRCTGYPSHQHGRSPWPPDGRRSDYRRK